LGKFELWMVPWCGAAVGGIGSLIRSLFFSPFGFDASSALGATLGGAVVGAGLSILLSFCVVAVAVPLIAEWQAARKLFER
jgi:uncharacterized membrane protein YjjB (DUF3815 family)